MSAKSKKHKHITGLIFFAITVLYSVACPAQIMILFDATKGEMAGNADWVIDADQTNIGVGSSGSYVTSPGHKSNPQQTPTPAQSAITSSTPETFWTGGLSSWGIDCVHKGFEIETLPWNGQITYGNSGNPQDLTHYQVFIIDEPNLQFSASEKTALIQFVQNGGGLFMIADHNVSDRNGDGWDSPHIWDDLLNNNIIQPNPFGILFDTVDFSQTTTNISATPTDSIIHGPYGNVTKVQWAGGTTMNLSPTANPTVTGVVFKSGTTPGNSKAMVAYARYGLGRVAAIGDSSPTDDGTGNPDCTLYNGYWADASGNHRLLLMNITIWLANSPTNTKTESTVINNEQISIYPNPAFGTRTLRFTGTHDGSVITVYSITGVEVLRKNLTQDEIEFQLSVPSGMYIIKVDDGIRVQKTRILLN